MLSRITIIGRLGKDPEIKQTKSGSNMCSMSVAVDSGFGNNKTTTWYRVSAFGKNAEGSAKYLKKGSLICASGDLAVNEFEGKDGSTKLSLNITADKIVFLSGRQGQTSNGGQSEPQDQTDAHNDDSFLEEESMPF